MKPNSTRLSRRLFSAALLLAAAAGCAHTPQPGPGEQSPGVGTLMLAPRDGYHYVATQTAPGEIETNPPRVSVVLVGSGESLSPIIDQVTPLKDLAPGDWRAQELGSDAWNEISGVSPDGSLFTLLGADGTTKTLGAAALRFKRLENMGDQK